MAQGIDWFRWHHGTVTDQKFPLIAKRSGASVAEVIAVWACLLEAASMNERERGMLDAAPDFEAMDCALGLVDGRAQAIFEAMAARKLVDEQMQLTAWPRRQPKRERNEDAPSTSRVKAFRERQRQPDTSNTGNGDETPRNADERKETPREEKRREEGIQEADASSSSPGAPTRLPCPHGRIQALYNEILPELPEAKLWGADRERAARQRWSEIAKVKGWSTQDDGVTWFRRFFEAVRVDDFLMGRTAPGKGHEGWHCTVDYLLSTTGFRRVFEANAPRREEAAT